MQFNGVKNLVTFAFEKQNCKEIVLQKCYFVSESKIAEPKFTLQVIYIVTCYYYSEGEPTKTFFQEKKNNISAGKMFAFYL